MKKINVGIIGLGVGFKHLENLKKINKVNKIYLFDFNFKKLNKLPIITNSKKLLKVKNEKEIFQNPDVDLVCICSYDNYHFSHVKESLKHNKHIFVEKPLCLTSNELNFIKKKVTHKKNIFLSSNFVLRENSFFKKIKKRIKKNYFGKIYLIEANYNYGRLEKIVNGWRGKIKNYSVTLGGGIHLIDLVTQLTNKKLKSVISQGNNISTKPYGSKFFDCVSSIIRCSDESTIVLISNFGSITPHHHVLKIYGTKATAIYDLNNFLFINNKNKKKIFKFRSIKNEKTKILKDFIDKLVSNKRNDKKTLFKEKNDLIKVTQHCLEIDKSIRSKNWRKI